jgi:hypothetical protein
MLRSQVCIFVMSNGKDGFCKIALIAQFYCADQ